MTRRELGALAFKIFAVWLFVIGLESLSWVVASGPLGTLRSLVSGRLTGYIVDTLLFIVTAIVLWFMSRSLAEQVLPGDDDPVVWPSANATSLLAAGIFIIGVAAVAGAIPGVVLQVLIRIPAPWGLEPAVDNKILSGLLKIGVGLALVILARPIASATERLPEVGDEEN